MASRIGGTQGNSRGSKAPESLTEFLASPAHPVGGTTLGKAGKLGSDHLALSSYLSGTVSGSYGDGGDGGFSPPSVDPNPPSYGGDGGGYSPPSYGGDGGGYSPPSVNPNPPSYGGDGGYTPPSNGDGGYTPPVVNPNPPSNGDGGYTPPSNGDGGYTPPVVNPNPPSNGDGGYTPPVVDPNPPSNGDGGYTPPVVDPNPPSYGGDGGYNPAPPVVDPNPPSPVYVPPYVDPNPPTVIDPTPIIIGNDPYYAPSYYDPSSYSAWGGGFWSGYLQGYADGSYNQAAWDQNYQTWNGLNPGAYWNVPTTVWSPYYQQVLGGPSVIVDNYYVDYNWQHPPLNKNQDPLEQLAFYHQLQKPSHFMWIFPSHTEISAEEARARLSQGLEVDVAGVAVHSFQQLAQIVPEMEQGQTVQGNQLPSDARSALQAIAKSAKVTQFDTKTLAAKLPAFGEVYAARKVMAEAKVGGKSINRTMDAAETVYGRASVRQTIAQWWKQNPKADRNALNQEINTVVTQALVADLKANGALYAKTPSSAANPVDYLEDPSKDPKALAYNQEAIQTVLNNATPELAANLITQAALKK